MAHHDDPGRGYGPSGVLRARTADDAIEAAIREFGPNRLIAAV